MTLGQGEQHGLGMNGIVVDVENWTNTVLWAEISTRKDLINRNTDDMSRVRRLHNWHQKTVRYNFVRTGSPRYSPQSDESVQWTGVDWKSSIINWPVVNALRALYSPQFHKQLSQGKSKWQQLSTQTVRDTDTRIVTLAGWQFPSEELVSHAVGKLIEALGQKYDQSVDHHILTAPPGAGPGDGVVTTSLPGLDSPSKAGRKRKRRRAPGPEVPAEPEQPLPEGTVDQLQPGASPRLATSARRNRARSRGAGILAGIDEAEEKKSASSNGAVVLIGLGLVAAFFAFS